MQRRTAWPGYESNKKGFLQIAVLGNAGSFFDA